jgi:hypothetical protein
LITLLTSQNGVPAPPRDKPLALTSTTLTPTTVITCGDHHSEMSGYDRYVASQAAAHTTQEPTVASAQPQLQEDMSLDLAFNMNLLAPPTPAGEPTSSVTAAFDSASQAVQRGDFVVIGAIVFLTTSAIVFLVRVAVNMRKSQWLVDPAADAPADPDASAAEVVPEWDAAFVATSEKVQLLKAASLGIKSEPSKTRRLGTQAFMASEPSQTRKSEPSKTRRLGAQGTTIAGMFVLEKLAGGDDGGVDLRPMPNMSIADEQPFPAEDRYQVPISSTCPKRS